MGEFFSNRELYDIIQDAMKEMTKLNKEMAETRVIIRDYNSLRKKLEQTSIKVDKTDAKVHTLMWIVGVSIPMLSLLFTFLNYIRS